MLKIICIPIRGYSCYVDIICSGVSAISKNTTFRVEVSWVSLIVYTYMYIGLKHLKGSKNQMYTKI